MTIVQSELLNVCSAEPIAPPLITNPAQTAFHQASQVSTAPVVDGQNVAPGNI